MICLKKKVKKKTILCMILCMYVTRRSKVKWVWFIMVLFVVWGNGGVERANASLLDGS